MTAPDVILEGPLGYAPETVAALLAAHRRTANAPESTA